LVTIKDTHENQEKIGKAIADLNALIGQQIYMNVNVYAVTKDASDDYGLDWNIAWNALQNSAGYVTSSGSTASNKLNVGVLTGPFTGSSVMMQALSKLGKTSMVNEFQITTLNGQPTPVGNVKKIPYISGVSSTPSTVVGQPPTYTMETSSVFQGINMSITPKVQPNGKILLEYAMNLSDFQGFTTLTTGSGSSAQSLSLPITTLKNILQRASLRSGQSLVLSGFKQAVASTSNSGVGNADNMILGGAKTAQNQEQYLVITVTPYVAQDND
jgi:type IVB pilus formation R64 PilN family outer membrane protein